jgi:hypothetical protein
MGFIGSGTRRLLDGIRVGDPKLVLWGAAIAAIGLVRRLGPPKRQLVYSRNLKKGEAIKIRLARPSSPAPRGRRAWRVGGGSGAGRTQDRR